MVRKSIEDLDKFKDEKPLMDLMYNIRTNDESITCYDNLSNTLTNIPYIKKEDRIKEQQQEQKQQEQKQQHKDKEEKKKSKSNTTSNTSNTT
jgi:hypothetical protein